MYILFSAQYGCIQIFLTLPAQLVSTFIFILCPQRDNIGLKGNKTTTTSYRDPTTIDAGQGFNFLSFFTLKGCLFSCTLSICTAKRIYTNIYNKKLTLAVKIVMHQLFGNQINISLIETVMFRYCISNSF